MPGREVLAALELGLGLGSMDLQRSSGVLREYGNVSSPFVLFVLERALAEEGAGRPVVDVVLRRRVQLSRCLLSGMNPCAVFVEPELLDALPADDPQAIGSRADLRRLNFLMGHAAHLSCAVRHPVASDPLQTVPLQLVELGARATAVCCCGWPGAGPALV